jgi:hypothetical protein
MVGMTTRLDTSSMTRAAKRLRKVELVLAPVAEATVDDFAAVVLINVRKRRLRHRGTGKGARMVNVRAKGRGLARVARVHASGRVAPIIAGGSRPHMIRVGPGEAIPLYGGSLFAASVQHPGTRADPFVHKGIRDARAQVQKITDDAARELAADVAHELRRR